MPCKQWNDDWVAELYGELDAAESERLTAHLRRCEACAQTFRQLELTRHWLRDATPAVPPIPKVVVLRQRSRWHPAWAFAAGAAAAALLFAVALGVGPDRQSTALQQIENRLARVEARDPQQTEPAGGPELLTRSELDDELTRWMRRIDVARAKDFEFLLGEINATERRVDSEILSNRQTLQYAVLASQPGVSER